MAERALRTLAERQIQKAVAEGRLSGLTGEGAPLPQHPEEALIDAGTAVGHRIMAEAGALPEEVILKRKIAAAREAYQEAQPEQKKAAMATLADLEMRLAIAQDARRKFFE
ncbi:MAG: DUF1992 domain-containing protein [Pseudomonadota bacterium]